MDFIGPMMEARTGRKFYRGEFQEIELNPANSGYDIHHQGDWRLHGIP